MMEVRIFLCLFLSAISVLVGARENGVCDQLKGTEGEVFLPWLQAVVHPGKKSIVASYKEVLKPVAEMTKLSYTGNISESIPGFSLVETMLPENGLNALAYLSKSVSLPLLGISAIQNVELVAKNRNKSGIVIAFRGTTTTSDRCADILLWNPQKRLPLWCRVFGKNRLNYTATALEFAGRVKQKFPGIPILFTGHSLGAALAEMMSLASNGSSPSLCFASGGAKGPSARYNLLTKSSDITCSVQIVNPWDPIVHFSMNDQIGYICTYHNVSEPKPCAKCFKQGRASIACEKCFNDAHMYINYLHLLNRNDTPACFLKPEIKVRNEFSIGQEIVAT